MTGLGERAARSGPTARAEPAARTEVTAERLAREFLAALGRADRDAAVALAHQRLELLIPTAPRGVPKVVTGRDGLADMVSDIARTWTEVSVELVRVDTFASDPDRGVAQSRVGATNRDGSRYDNTYVALFEVEDGLIRRWVEYYDPAPMVATIDALRAHVRADRGSGPGD